MKDVASLIASRAQREKIVESFGVVPESILLHNKAIKAIDLMVDVRSYDSTSYYKRKERDDGNKGKIADAFNVSGRTCRGKGGALSRFPQNVGRTLLMLYTKPWDIVVDPFAGHNSRMELCFRANRHYFANDLSATFMEANRAIKEILEKEFKEDLFSGDRSMPEIVLTEGDSKHLTFEDEFADFTITSPPYWDLEYYGDEPEQLGIGKSYDVFLDGLGQVAKENYRCLKPGSFCVWCVNDFRKGGKFYSYHEHTAEVLRKAGFIQHDIAITDLGSSFRAVFAQQVIDSKILPKRHEYCLIFKK